MSTNNIQVNEIEVNKQVYILKDSIKNIQKEQIIEVEKVKGTPYLLEQNYLIRTVTMIYTGKLKEVYDKELVITSAAWIPDTGRWQQAVEKGSFSEVELYPETARIIINRDVILDCSPIIFELPKNQK